MNKIRFVEPKASRIKNKSTPTPLLLKKLAYRRFRRLHPAPSGRKKLKS
ncbi:MAG: hypothetical protein LBB29_02930 [Holosporaceae bacterium]|nr:hypothetical protein [Holosporaceae bacterium]